MIEPAAVRLPAVGAEIRILPRRTCVLVRCSALQCGMSAVPVEVILELKQLVFEINGRPEERAVQLDRVFVCARRRKEGGTFCLRRFYGGSKGWRVSEGWRNGSGA